ncbi:hypothetical protein LQ567_04985 [Niabella pedocola]|uniref:Uncharacterized protein n=1 Tax=Niabella pedocola TaxID=1752077 RepID=A0ABS8PQJ8_9BACT|nr:hypothetical protein [Niabella pedocola]MCD2422106.1 hypothetical protein [Niabella pedocola]
MISKKVSAAQVPLLQKGTIIKRFPSNGVPEEQFDEARKADTDIFEICSINVENDMIELITPGRARGMFSSPCDVSHLFIKSCNLVAQNIWWI